MNPVQHLARKTYCCMKTKKNPYGKLTAEERREALADMRQVFREMLRAAPRVFANVHRNRKAK